MTAASRTFFVLPFLKSSGTLSIGGLTFRSTGDSTDLTPGESVALSEISEMLFLKDDFRMKSGSYATVPFVDFNDPGEALEPLARIQTLIAYAYASAPIHAEPFLSTEYCSVALFSPTEVPYSLVYPDHHVASVRQSPPPPPNERHTTPGYHGLYNFHHHFWVAKGSRLYAPVPTITLNISQDLSSDLYYIERVDLALLITALLTPTVISERVLTALSWFNKVTSDDTDPPMRLVALAVAFESLLAFPDAEKRTERLVDAISLLLGRIPRLDTWARQFYDARSSIVHTGRVSQMRFLPLASKRDAATYAPLLSYGREIFKLCVGTLLVGADLAERAGLKETLVTNQERFEEICKLLSASSSSEEHFGKITPLIRALHRFQFVGESGLTPAAMLGAARMAAKLLEESVPDLDPTLRTALLAVANAQRSPDHFVELQALGALASEFQRGRSSGPRSENYETVAQLIEVVWHYTFMYYYALEEQKKAQAQQPPSPGGP